jgi:tight adherence protein B
MSLGPLGIVIAIALLAMLSAGGLAWFLLYGRIEAESTVGRRLQRMKARGMAAEAAPDRIAEAARRRKSVQETLAEIEAKQKAKAKEKNALSLTMRLVQAGLKWSRRGYFVFCAISGASATILGLVLGAPLWAVAAFGVAGVVGVPMWTVNLLRRRRMRRFLAEFANAIDVIVRGVKAGLPLNDCIRIVAAEAAEPVRSEFRQIAESQAIGLSMADAVARLPERVPVPETSFFAIVVAIQQRAGGNLSEALGNLSRVLRDRKKMTGKIKAMSMEAKASAVIIGALPVVVMGLVYVTSPDYVALLFSEPLGHIILGASAVWMAIGIFVMRRMVNFDF